MTRHLLPLLACVAAGLLAGCEADDSLPSRPRTGTIFTADPKAQDNAERRSLEAPQRQMPPAAPNSPASPPPRHHPDPHVITLDAPANTPAPTPQPQFPHLWLLRPPHARAIGHTTGPETTYTRDSIPASFPTCPQPRTIPMTGSTPIPGGDWSVDHSWGQGLTLTQAPTQLAQTTVTYQQIDGKNNPLYYFKLAGTHRRQTRQWLVRGDIRSTLYEMPWFYANTIALPVLMVLEPPSPSAAQRPSQDPIFTGYLPTAGPIVPAPPQPPQTNRPIELCPPRSLPFRGAFRHRSTSRTNLILILILLLL